MVLGLLTAICLTKCKATYLRHTHPTAFLIPMPTPGLSVHKPEEKLVSNQTYFANIKKLGDLGLLAINVPEKWGRVGQGTSASVVAVEEITKERFETEKLKEEFLKPFTSGTLASYSFSEPDVGNDNAAMPTTAVLDGDSYVLNGISSCDMSGTVGKAAIVFATVDKSLKYKGITAFLFDNTVTENQ